VVEGARLESVYRGNSIEGSNPSLSAIVEFDRLYAELKTERKSFWQRRMGKRNGIKTVHPNSYCVRCALLASMATFVW
jgi:hypothetical protein